MLIDFQIYNYPDYKTRFKVFTYSVMTTLSMTGSQLSDRFVQWIAKSRVSGATDRQTLRNKSHGLLQGYVIGPSLLEVVQILSDPDFITAWHCPLDGKQWLTLRIWAASRTIRKRVWAPRLTTRNGH